MNTLIVACVISLLVSTSISAKEVAWIDDDAPNPTVLEIYDNCKNALEKDDAEFLSSVCAAYVDGIMVGFIYKGFADFYEEQLEITSSPQTEKRKQKSSEIKQQPKRFNADCLFKANKDVLIERRLAQAFITDVENSRFDKSLKPNPNRKGVIAVAYSILQPTCGADQ